eukprot:CAMPEP_0117618858 /NCGR_PEP_ID=MMETSP0784-20121206/86321_1 /TAXON_ID=39447 /ORGANISM="" /LENGTH=84 /DNA_ID=CAMNT_0005422737 /DNA_START=1 /DNA_END=255 /DNA_ORIENTATION=+
MGRAWWPDSARVAGLATSSDVCREHAHECATCLPCGYASWRTTAASAPLPALVKHIAAMCLAATSIEQLAKLLPLPILRKLCNK